MEKDGRGVSYISSLDSLSQNLPPELGISPRSISGQIRRKNLPQAMARFPDYEIAGMFLGARATTRQVADHGLDLHF